MSAIYSREPCGVVAMYTRECGVYAISALETCDVNALSARESCCVDAMCARKCSGNAMCKLECDAICAWGRDVCAIGAGGCVIYEIRVRGLCVIAIRAWKSHEICVGERSFQGLCNCGTRVESESSIRSTWGVMNNRHIEVSGSVKRWKFTLLHVLETYCDYYSPVSVIIGKTENREIRRNGPMM